MGRPPKPLEQKRMTGRHPGVDSGGRKLPEVASVTALPMADGVPDPPADLLLDGRRLWERAWGAAITWLSPDSDMEAVENACRLADDLAVARRRYRATSDPTDGRVVVQLAKSVSDALSVLGFDPTARSRLGVAEVKRASALEQLIATRQAR
jgi:phage terminase small subunit